MKSQDELKGIITEAIKVNYTNCYELNDFEISDLIELAKIAKKENLELRIVKHSSNLYSGTVLEVQRNWDRVKAIN